jgi:hypothetical protein
MSSFFNKLCQLLWKKNIDISPHATNHKDTYHRDTNETIQEESETAANNEGTYHLVTNETFHEESETTTYMFKQDENSLRHIFFQYLVSNHFFFRRTDEEEPKLVYFHETFIVNNSKTKNIRYMCYSFLGKNTKNEKDYSYVYFICDYVAVEDLLNENKISYDSSSKKHNFVLRPGHLCVIYECDNTCSINIYTGKIENHCDVDNNSSSVKKIFFEEDIDIEKAVDTEKDIDIEIELITSLSGKSLYYNSFTFCGYFPLKMFCKLDDASPENGELSSTLVDASPENGGLSGTIGKLIKNLTIKCVSSSNDKSPLLCNKIDDSTEQTCSI